MLTDIEKMLIEGNFQFQSKINQNLETTSFDQRNPKYPILFLTCMDTRIDIHRIFQLNPGDVFIIRNAGNICTLDMMRSIIITIYKYKVKYIIILGHTDCGMTRINMSEVREELPFELFKRLSTKHSDFLSNLYEFFKPFDNEISNIIHQINDLHAIKPFFPDVEIIGMLYDIQTGWVFKQEDFRDLLTKENHTKIYERLLNEKNQQRSKFFGAKENSLAEKEIVDESELKEESEHLEVIEPNLTDPREDILKISDNNKDPKLQISLPKIQIPKIYIPKITIHIPKCSKIQEN